MSNKVDDRIVNMKFNNSQFEKGVSDTAKSLETLKKNLDLKDTGKGLGDIAGSLKNLPLEGVANGVQAIANKFTALSVIGITALANIASKAVDAGLTLARSLTIDPVKAGFDEYELKMGSIQTILANTARYGTQLPEVVANLDELNKYADKTIYNFGDMTKNIGLFTNAGIRIEDATSMIKGFSNEAAASGTNAQGAASAAYQLSQALSAGTIRLMDWRSLQNVGMGNKNMQNGLIEIAGAMGMLNDETTTAEDIQANFNGSLEKNWLSADVMSTYLKIMSGDMDEATQASLGLTSAQIEMFRKQQQMGEDAATKVRTWTQLVGTLQESVGSGWAQTFDILIGDFDKATDLWTGVNNKLGPIIEGMATARNEFLQSFVDAGGRDAVIGTLSSAFDTLMSILRVIQRAWADIFPPATGEQIANIAKTVQQFVENLRPSPAVFRDIQSTAKGFFAVLDIGWMILKQVIGLFGRLVGAIAPAGSGILGMTGDLGDWLVSVRDAIKDGEALGKVFDFLGDMGEKVIGFIGRAAEYLGDTFPISNWALAWENVGKAIQAVWEWLQPFFAWVSKAFAEVKNAVSEAFKAMDFNVLVGLLNAGLLGGIFLIIKKFIDKIPEMFSGIGGGIFDTIKGSFSALTDTMQAMQQKLKADILIKIAIAIGILTAAVVALSFIDTGKLFTSLGAMSLMFTQLMAAMLIMDKATSTKGYAKMPVLAATLMGLATAMVIFSAAVAIMAQLDWDQLARGMSGMAVGLGIMVGALLLLDKVKYSIAQSAGGLILMATGLVILASALKIMGSMSWDDIGRAMVVLGGGLAALAIGAKLVQGNVAGAAAMIVVASALTIISGALKVFATLSWDDIGRSLVAMGVSVGLLVGAIAILSTLKMAPVGAATMVAMAVAITILVGAMKAFGEMSWEEIGKSLVMLAGSLAILAGAMALMGIPLVALGGLALFVVSAGMMMLAPALALLGTMSWDAIGRGLAMLAASLAILAVGGLLMIPASVGFLLLGAAIMLIGTGAFLAGTGMVMFAAGFIALTGAAAVGAEAIKMALETLISLIPSMMTAFAQGLIDFALVLAQGGVEFTAAMITLLQSLIDAITAMGPQVIDTLWNLVMLMSAKLTENIPILVQNGADLIIGILNGMTEKVPLIARAGTDLMIALIRAISNEAPRLANEGQKAIIRFVNEISSSIDRNSAAMGAAGGRLAASIVRGMANGIGAGIGEVVNAARRMAENALNAAKDFLGINSPSKEFHYLGEFSSEGYAGGVLNMLGVVEKAGQKVGQTALVATKKSLAKISEAVASDMSMAPTIRPVLDLTAIKKDSALIGGLLTPPSLKLDKSIAYASQAQMAGYQAEKAANDVEFDRLAVASRGDVNFTQINNSPKALPEAEIYRKTKNVISEAKKELTTLDAK